MLYLGAGAAAVLVIVLVAALTVFRSNGPAHSLTIPDKLGAYLRRPQLEKQMDARQLQRQVIAKSAGQVSHVISAVYENNVSTNSAKTPQMILFIGGNLSGVSARASSPASSRTRRAPS